MNTYESNSKELNKTNLISIINYERIRYKRKGYGFLGAIFITIFFFLYLPIIFNKVYQNFFYFKFNEGLYFFTFIMIFDKILLYSFLIIYWLIYRSKLNLFERYKVNDNPWPWEKDRFEWDKMLKSCLNFHIINKYLVVTIINIPSMIEGKCYVELSSDKVPEVFDVSTVLLLKRSYMLKSNSFPLISSILDSIFAMISLWSSTFSLPNFKIGYIR